MPKLPRAHLDHKVPSGYWKLITVQKGDKLLTAMFEMDQNMGRKDDYCSAAVTIREVEKRDHLNYFPRMTQDQQSKIKTSRGELLPLLGCK